MTLGSPQPSLFDKVKAQRLDSMKVEHALDKQKHISNVYIYIYTNMYSCMYVSTSILICKDLHTHVYMHIDICMYVCNMCACGCVCV